MPWGRLLGAAVPPATLVACASLAGLEDPTPIADAGAPVDGAVVVDANPAPDADLVIDSGLDAGDDYCREPDLVARWRFEDGKGTAVTDCSIHFLDGLANGGAAWVAGKFGTALSFTGNSFVDFGNPAALRITGAITLAAWVNLHSASVTSASRVISKSGLSGARGWEINLETDGSIRFRVTSDGTTSFEASAPAFPLDTWKHVAGVYEPGVAVRIFVDGMQISAVTTGIPTMQFDAEHTVRIGERPGDNCCALNGTVDDVRVYKRALGATDIRALLTP